MATQDPRDPEGRDPDDPEANGPGAMEPASDDVAERGDSPAATVPGVSTKQQSGPRFLNFLKACWAELQRVQWPDRRQVGQATAVVIGFVIIAGAYLGVADALAQELVDLII